jgi:hypothetical protein
LLEKGSIRANSANLQWPFYDKRFRAAFKIRCKKFSPKEALEHCDFALRDEAHPKLAWAGFITALLARKDLTNLRLGPLTTQIKLMKI